MKSINEKSELTPFYERTYNSWLDGDVLEFIPKSKAIAEANTLEGFIEIIENNFGKSLHTIADKAGFVDDEILAFARSNRFLMTNKRLFVSEDKGENKQFDIFFLNNIKTIKNQGIFDLKITLMNGKKMIYNISGSYITTEGMHKIMKIRSSETDERSDYSLPEIQISQGSDQKQVPLIQESWKCSSCGAINNIEFETCSNSECKMTKNLNSNRDVYDTSNNEKQDSFSKKKKFNKEEIKVKLDSDFQMLKEPLGYFAILLIILFISTFWKDAIFGLILLAPMIWWIAKGGIASSISAFFRILINLIRLILKF